ncbi:MAG: hypothetical protein EOM34_07360 [Clostridia bacterium]|jgi:hypothetical protein|nr:hypothetical protein [Lachnospiraceae bacterium]NCC00486.1 hypothetical protein [Clostridia bacterium]NCD02497.1 hypothetical protein [Clostridia bacterium]
MADRDMDFRMERPDLVEVGQHVTMTESILKTLSGTMYYYTINDAIAMSNNTPKRLQHLEGIVKSLVEEESVFTVTVTIKDEPEGER